MSASATSALTLPAARPPGGGARAFARAARSVLPVALGLGTAAFLLNRSALAALGAGVLLVGYAAMTAGSVAATGRRGRDRAAPAGLWIPLAAGLLAVVLARAASGIAPPVPVTASVVVLNVAAAVAEEAFFRGFLFARLQPWGVGVAVIVTALLFALIHLPLYGAAALPVDLGAGLLLSWQRAASGTWAAPAATHALANVVAVLR